MLREANLEEFVAPAVDNGHKRRFRHIINPDQVFGTFSHRYCQRKRSNPGPRVKLWVASSRSLSSASRRADPLAPCNEKPRHESAGRCYRCSLVRASQRVRANARPLINYAIRGDAYADHASTSQMSRRSSGLRVTRFLTFYLLSDILLNGPRAELSG
jgi:hypothetical protein